MEATATPGASDTAHRNLRLLSLAAGATLLLDLPAKFWVESAITLRDRVPVIDGFFYLTHARNPGAAFGLFENAPHQWRLAAFLAVTILAVTVISSFFRRLAPGDERNALALGLILGGTFGNLFDRLWRGEVIDYLHVRLWSGYLWPDFNLADVAIIVGVAALIIELLVSEVSGRVGLPVD
ncbi:MAG: signal peptidase II [Myxococcota bacterium]